MECLNEYREIIGTFLAASIDESADDPSFETQLIGDRDHYQLVSLSWQGHRRFYDVLIHLDIKDGKVWIQRNDTDRLIAQDLMALGVAREDIVLGLQPAYARADTEYSVA
jgi:XisI protein